ncbi:NADH dehydrogenase [Raphidocelis subcapitata]|uniref:NADH dehydrogenase n=1 Tax=Raphidocelis subcapitata TaxID=307507 RepID=A0A2V0NRR7_9CHLO|nr:NADH dehydrogenase [Raphidocelis subcapitata]|eukprot:GBF88253.1 NADH dehydrogenase [Raphidocelis subcapitata]
MAFSAISAQLRRAARTAPAGASRWLPSRGRSLHAPTRAAAAAADGDAAAAAAGPAAGAADAAAAAPGGSPRICVLGGGFGGLYTAVKLETLIWPKGRKPRVTLVDQGERFVFKPLLYELLNGTAQPWEVAPTFSQLLAPYPVQFVQARVAEVQPGRPLAGGGSGGGGRVVLEGGGEIEYDWLVIALGAESDPRGVPGVRELARPFVTLDDATHVDARLSALEAAAAAGGVERRDGAGLRAPRAVVVGAGYAGVELASVIGERVKGRGVEVRVVTPTEDILPGSPQGQRAAARDALAGAGVRVDGGVRVERLGEGGGDGRCVVHLAGANGPSELEADLVVWTAGLAPASKFVKSLPFPSTAAGAIETDPTLRVLQHARVFALGDVSFAEQEQEQQQQGSYPATAQVAFQQADYAAWNLWAAINGRPLLPFRYQHLGSMMSLGAANAAVALPVELPAALADTIRGSPLEGLLSLAGVRAAAPGAVTLEGPLAQLLRRAAYLYRQPTGEQRLSVAASWLQQAADVAASAARELSGRTAPSGGGGGGGGGSA